VEELCVVQKKEMNDIMTMTQMWSRIRDCDREMKTTTT